MSTLNVKSSASGGGDGSSGSPYTLQEAFDNAAAGDEIYVWDDATYEEATQIDVDRTSGSDTQPIVVRGVDSSGAVFADELDEDNRVHIRCTSGHTSTYLLNANKDRWVFKNLWLDGRDSTGTKQANRVMTVGASGWGCKFINCEFSHSDDTFACVYVTTYTTLTFCRVHDSDGDGLSLPNTHNSFIYACQIHDNADVGIYSSGRAHLADCLVYDNGGHGVHLAGASAISGMLTGNTIYGNTGSGVYVAGVPYRHEALVYNNTSSGNGVYGFYFSHASADNAGLFLDVMDRNHTHDNTSGATNLSGGMPGDSNATGDPLFADTDDGTEDFTPGTSSPLLNVGLDAGTA